VDGSGIKIKKVEQKTDMKPEEIKITDWLRVFVGEVPPEFFIEVFIRMFFVYLLLIVSMRLLGKRMASQLTQNELAGLVSLAAAVGVPLLAPDRGMLPALVICIVVVAITRLLNALAVKNEKTEMITQGEIDTLVRDSVLDLETMSRTKISKERIMAQLRSEQLLHLGQVQRLYAEANGNFALVKNEIPKPGLIVLPSKDQAFRHDLKPNGIVVCDLCGLEKDKGSKTDPCRNCQNKGWEVAVEGLA
jgi:uncharacterized membrane protein YcaP (DUF421 family)